MTGPCYIAHRPIGGNVKSCEQCWANSRCQVYADLKKAQDFERELESER